MASEPKRVIVESPYAGDREANEAYALLAMQDCLERGEAPFLSHLLYTRVWDDDDPKLRASGIAAGLAWGSVAAATIVYCDRGISRGMQIGIEHARAANRSIEYRAFSREGIAFAESINAKSVEQIDLAIVV